MRLKLFLILEKSEARVLQKVVLQKKKSVNFLLKLSRRSYSQIVGRLSAENGCLTAFHSTAYLFGTNVPWDK